MIAAACRAGSIALLLASAADVDGVTTIDSAGVGTLTICVDWMPFHGCQVYEQVALPRRLAIGDTLSLEFGDAKHFEFPVARIIKNGIRCTVLSQANGEADKIDSIKVPACLDVSGNR
ncbi:MAG TPA: hypothetical protein VM782_09965 [Stellaceae bacterium]|nr:hypothetical protein [Stellaceae bacterium]